MPPHVVGAPCAAAGKARDGLDGEGSTLRAVHADWMEAINTTHPADLAASRAEPRRLPFAGAMVHPGTHASWQGWATQQARRPRRPAGCTQAGGVAASLLDDESPSFFPPAPDAGLHGPAGRLHRCSIITMHGPGQLVRAPPPERASVCRRLVWLAPWRWAPPWERHSLLPLLSSQLAVVRW